MYIIAMHVDVSTSEAADAADVAGWIGTVLGARDADGYVVHRVDVEREDA